jgi:glycosidase
MSRIYQRRLQKNIEELQRTYFSLYKPFGANQEDFDSLLEMMKLRFEERSPALHKLDKRPKKWYMSKKMIGYMVYTDLFADNLNKLKTKIPYLKELGITYVHLMPLLKPREGENDGGYAVEDYLDIDPALGTIEEFDRLLDAFRKAKIDVCIDYVINHTADTHVWAQKALEGDPYYQDMFYMYDDRTIPDMFDQHVPEVLPVKCPGNFTYNKQMDKWVFTSFSDFQWDLNFQNPVVFQNMVSIMLQLANLGVNIIRLDAIPFMWKEVGTTCRNLPQIHDLLDMFKLIKNIVAPSLAILGEAIVEPHEIFKYFGTEEKTECGLLYNANFMVNIWNAFATRDVRLLNIDNKRFSELPSESCWMNYVRCHDDIGWGFNEEAIEAFDLSPFHHKQYLIDFYSGAFPGSFSKGENYQYNAVSKDARTNGTTASLLGLEKAIEERYVYEQDIAIQRIKLAHAMIFAHRGIPLIYSGDEIASLNDQSYKEDPKKRNEGRWVHRPIFDWKRSKKRKDNTTFEHRVFSSLKQMAKIRKRHVLFNGDVPLHVIENSDISVYSFYKQKGSKTMVCLFNFSEHIKYISTHPYGNEGLYGEMQDLFTGRAIDFSSDTIRLAPYEVLWVQPNHTK